ncbi:MAG: efflux RND transporter periplasmic adaptor subunit [Desulfovibrio sp.]
MRGNPCVRFFAGFGVLLLFCSLAAGPAQARGTDSLVVRAQLTAVHEAPLAAAIQARIKDLPLREGDSFATGDLLLAYDCADREAEYQRAAAGYRATRSKLKANEELNRLNSISTVEVDLSRAEVDIAKAEQEVQAMRLKQCKEFAPFAGRVAALYVKRYQRVSPGDPLMTVVDPSRLEAECIVPSKWLRWLKVGHPIDLLVEETGDTVRAVVESIAPFVDPVSQTVKVRASVEAVPGLLPGMSGTAAFLPAQ